MKEIDNVILWGASYDYDIYYHAIELEKRKGNICVDGIILCEERFATYMDGLAVLQVDYLRDGQFDYVIVLTKEMWEIALQIASKLGIPREKFVFVKILTLPLFDWKRWLKVRSSKVCILSNQCWGGITYEALQMPFYSPMVGMYETDEDFLKIAENPEHYFSQQLECVEWVHAQEKKYPIVKCDDVILNMNHHFGTWEETCNKWERRTSRLQLDNICVQMHVYDERYLERFLKLPYKRKIAFTTVECNHEQVIFMDEKYLNEKYGEQLFMAPLQQAAIGKAEFTRYDILGLLLGEDDFKRI